MPPACQPPPRTPRSGTLGGMNRPPLALGAVVLAGGTAARMGGVDKASIELDGRTLLEPGRSTRSSTPARSSCVGDWVRTEPSGDLHPRGPGPGRSGRRAAGRARRVRPRRRPRSPCSPSTCRGSRWTPSTGCAPRPRVTTARCCCGADGRRQLAYVLDADAAARRTTAVRRGVRAAAAPAAGAAGPGRGAGDRRRGPRRRRLGATCATCADLTGPDAAEADLARDLPERPTSYECGICESPRLDRRAVRRARHRDRGRRGPGPGPRPGRRPQRRAAGGADHDVPARVRRRRPGGRPASRSSSWPARPPSWPSAWDRPPDAVDPDEVAVEVEIPDDQPRRPHRRPLRGLTPNPRRAVRSCAPTCVLADEVRVLARRGVTSCAG